MTLQLKNSGILLNHEHRGGDGDAAKKKKNKLTNKKPTLHLYSIVSDKLYSIDVDESVKVSGVYELCKRMRTSRGVMLAVPTPCGQICFP